MAAEWLATAPRAAGTPDAPAPAQAGAKERSIRAEAELDSGERRVDDDGWSRIVPGEDNGVNGLFV